MKKKDKDKGSATSSKAQSTIKVEGAKKSSAVFNPPQDQTDDPTRYVGQTPAASTLTPNSSDRRADDSRAVSEAVVSITTRRKRANLMRRLATKLTRLRMFARNQMAPESRLTARANKLARNTVRSRFAGQRGKNYKDLSVSDKIAVDSMINNKQKLIKRIAQRLLPVVRKSEQLRLQGVRRGKKGKKVNNAGGLGIMPNPKLDRAEEVLRQQDIIAENIAYCILEGKTDKIDKLLKAGLADKSSVQQYKKALENPELAKKYSVLRDKAFEMLDKLIDTITLDPTIYFRTKDNIQKKYDHNKKNDKPMKESLTEGRKSKAEIARIAQAKKDHRTMMVAVGSGRSVKRSMEGKAPLRGTISSPAADPKEVVKSTVRSAVLMQRQVAARKSANPGMKTGPLKMTMTLSKPVQPVTAANVKLKTASTKKVSTEPTNTNLPHVTAPVRTPAINTLKPKSKPGLISKLITKFGKAATEVATNMFDLDDRRARLRKLERDTEYSKKLTNAKTKKAVTGIQNKSMSKNAVAWANSEAETDSEKMTAATYANAAGARGNRIARQLAAKHDARQTVKGAVKKISGDKVAGALARELAKAHTADKKKALEEINRQLSIVMMNHAKGTYSEKEYRDYMTHISAAFNQILRSGVNHGKINEAVKIGKHLTRGIQRAPTVIKNLRAAVNKANPPKKPASPNKPKPKTANKPKSVNKSSRPKTLKPKNNDNGSQKLPHIRFHEKGGVRDIRFR